MLNKVPRDALLLVARVLLASLFIIMGWQKLNDFPATTSFMNSVGAFFPAAAAVIAIIFELGIGIIVLIGFYVTPFALILALYTLISAFVAHHYWTMTGLLRHEMMIHFFKNLSLTGGLIALAVAGSGRYAVKPCRRPASDPLSGHQ